jgi:hypothetical protein
VKIHAAAYHPFMPLLGIDKKRLIFGTVQAKVLYLPEGTQCGTVDHFTANMLRKVLQAQIPYQVLRLLQKGKTYLKKGIRSKEIRVGLGTIPLFVIYFI